MKNKLTSILFMTAVISAEQELQTEVLAEHTQSIPMFMLQFCIFLQSAMAVAWSADEAQLVQFLVALSRAICPSENVPFLFFLLLRKFVHVTVILLHCLSQFLAFLYSL